MTFDTAEKTNAGKTRSQPHFAVIITVLNGQEYLSRTLEAVAAQTYPHFEVVVVDDGSTDNTAQITGTFCRRDARFHLIRTPNRGMSPSRNLAAAHSSGDWLAVCDGDDVWLPEKLAVQAQFITEWQGERPLAALGSRGYVINGDGKRCGELDVPLRPFPATVPAGNQEDNDESLDLRFINSSGVVSRAAFNAVGGYRADYTPSEDLDLWLRLSEYGEVLNVPERLTEYRLHGQNFSFKAYVVTQVAGRHAHHSAQRRRQGLPEQNRDEYLASLRADPTRYAQAMREYRYWMHVNTAKVSLMNGRPVPAGLAVVRAVLTDPLRTARLMAGSGLLRRIREGRRGA